MHMNTKIIAAVTGAVGMYLQEEQQRLLAVAQQPTIPAPPPASCSPWAMAGRQSMMDMRRFLQMRLVR